MTDTDLLPGGAERFRLEGAEPPQIAVILPTFARPGLLGRCLEGFAAQSLDPRRFEVVVVDDGTIPPVRGAVEEFTGRLNLTYRHQPNAGVAAARNAALLLAQAPLVALHDDDDTPAADYLERCRDFHARYPEEPDILLARVTPHPDLPRTPLLDWVMDPANGMIGFPEPGVYDHRWFYGGTSSCKRSLFRFGLYDPDYRFGMEDMDLALRLSAHVRLRVHYDGRVVSYLGRQQESGALLRRSYLEGRSQRRLYERHGAAALHMLPRGALDAAGTIAAVAPAVARLLAEARAAEPLGFDLPGSFVVHHRGEARSGLEGLRLAFSLCVAYARARGWSDYGNDVPTPRGLKSMDALLDAPRGREHEPGISAGSGDHATASVRSPRPHRSQPRSALVFFPHMPYPAHGGAQRRCESLLRALRILDYRIDLLTSTLFASGGVSLAHAGAFERALGARLHVHDGTPEDARFQALVDLPMERFTPPSLCRRFKELYWQTEPDLILVNYAQWGGLAFDRDYDDAVRLIDTLDLVTVNEALYRALEPYLRERPIDPAACDPRVAQEDFFGASLEAADEELRVYDQFDATFAISARDAETIRRGVRHTRVLELPMAFAPSTAPNSYDGPPVLVMADNPFNIQAYVYFARRVLPSLATELPGFRLRVIGPGCRAVRGVLGVELAGVVGDLTGIYQNAAYAVSPLLGGTGRAVKIVDAMAHGLPVVALDVLGRGAPIRHGETGFLAANAREFAEYCLMLSKDPGLCRKLGAAARETIRERHSPALLEERLSSAIALGRGIARARPVPLAACCVSEAARVAGRRLVIFGAGEAGRRCFEAVRSSASVVGFVDNDAGKDGLTLDGIPIRGPAALHDRTGGSVLIASAHAREIAGQLERMGLRPVQDFSIWLG